MWKGVHLDERWGLVEPEVWVTVGLVGLFRSGLVDRQGVSTERVGLFGSGRGDKFGCLSGILDCFGSGRVDRQRGVYWACWTIWVRPRRLVWVSVGRVGLFGSGLVDGQRVSAERVGLFGSGC